jgi:hypothetical protein
MTRELSTEMLSAITAGTIAPVLIAKIGTASGDINTWTGIGDLIFNAETYSGIGNFGGISTIQESSQLQATGVTFSLSGVPSSLISSVLGEMRYGKTAILWMGLIDLSTGLLVDSPIQVFSGLTDTATIDENIDTPVISINAESRLIDLERPRTRRYTTEDQQIDYPNDLGFEYVPSLQDISIVWLT